MNNNSPSLGTIILGTFAFVIVGYVAYAWVYVPYRSNSQKIVNLEDEVDRKEKEKKFIESEQDRLALKWNKFSLPNTVEKAAAEYGGMFKPLLSKAGLTVDDFKRTLPTESRLQASQEKKVAQHQILTFTVRARGNLAALTKAAESLRQVPVMHRVKQIVIDRADPKDKVGKLNITMTIEAMIVAGTDNHPSYRPSSLTTATLAQMALSERNFADLPKRDPFMGYVPLPPLPPPVKTKPVEVEKDKPPTGPDQREFIRIDTILPNLQEASLYDRSKNETIRLRAKPKSGYEVFKVTDEERGKMVMKGKVLRIDPRDVYFQMGEDVYVMHIGETLAEAMKTPMDPEEIEVLELTALIDPDFAEETKDLAKYTGGSNKTKKGNTKGFPTKGGTTKGSTKGTTGRKGL